MTGASSLIDELSVSSAVKLNGTAQASATNVALADGDEIQVTVAVNWPYGSTADNDSNSATGLTAELDALTITVKQNHNS